MPLCINAVSQAKPAGQRLNISQISLLEEAIANFTFLNNITLMKVIQQTGLTKQRVINWFSGRRRLVRTGKISGSIFESKDIYMYI